MVSLVDVQGLHIGSVAVGALHGDTALCDTGCSLTAHFHGEVMLAGGRNGLAVGDLLAALAVGVAGVAVSTAGCVHLAGNGVVAGVVSLVDVQGLHIGSVAVGTLHGHAALCDTGCSLTADFHGEVMLAGGGDGLSFTAQLLAALGAVGNFIVRAILAAGCVHFLFTDDFAGSTLGNSVLAADITDMIAVTVHIGAVGGGFGKDCSEVHITAELICLGKLVTGIVNPVVEGIDGMSIAGLFGRCVGVYRSLACQHNFGLHNCAINDPIDGASALDLPLGKEGGILGAGEQAAVGVSSAVAVSGGVPALKVHVAVGKGIGVQVLAAGILQNLSIHVAGAAVGIKGDGNALDPGVTGSAVVEGIACSCAGALHKVAQFVILSGSQIGAVAIHQLSRGHCQQSACGSTGLISCNILTCAGCHDDLTGLLGGLDGGTTLGGVQEAVDPDGTIDIQHGIVQVLGLGTGIGTAGSIAHGTHVQIAGVGEGEVALHPLITVIDNQTVAVAQCIDCLFGVADDQLGVCSNIHFHTGQQSKALVDGSDTGLQIDDNVIGNGQDIVHGVHIGAAQRHFHAVELCVAGEIHLQAVTVLNVVLGNGRACLGNEHTAGAHELNSSTQAHLAHEHRSSHIFLSTGFIGGGNLNILDIVLVDGEHFQRFGHIGGMGTATEVGELEVLIHLGTGLGGDGTGTLDIAPAVEVCAGVQGNGGAGLHLHPAQRARGRTAVSSTAVGSCVLTADFHRTVHLNAGIACQGQSAVSRGLNPGSIAQEAAGAACAGAIGGIAGIVGDQQRDTGRNHMAAMHNAVIQQHHSLAGCTGSGGKRSCIRQVKKLVGTHAEQGGIRRDKHRLQLGICRKLQRSLGIIGQICPGCDTVPSEERIAGCGGCHNSIALAGSLAQGDLTGDGSAVNGVAAVFSCQEGRIHCAGRQQLQTGQDQGVGAGSGGRSQSDGHTAAGCQFFRIGAGRAGNRAGNRTAAAEGEVKGQNAVFAVIIGDGKVSGNGSIGKQLPIALGGTGNRITVDRPAGTALGIAGIAPAQAQIFICGGQSTCHQIHNIRRTDHFIHNRLHLDPCCAFGFGLYLFHGSFRFSGMGLDRNDGEDHRHSHQERKYAFEQNIHFQIHSLLIRFFVEQPQKYVCVHNIDTTLVYYITLQFFDNPIFG